MDYGNTSITRARSGIATERHGTGRGSYSAESARFDTEW